MRRGIARGLAVAVLAWLPLATAGPRSVVVARDETLETIARRELGDPKAASEITALNGLAPGIEPKRKARLLIPGPERDRAIEALARARSRIEAGSSDTDRRAAGLILDRAWKALRGARYTDAEAEALAAERRLRGETVRFSVFVDPSGKESRVVVRDGTVSVDAAGKSATATRGQTVQTGGKRGVRIVVGAPSPPGLVEPSDGAVVSTDGRELTWAPPKGAVAYHVAVAKDIAFADRVASLQVQTSSLRIPPGLPKGVYYWRVSAVSSGGAESQPSALRRFEVTREPKGSPDDWQWGPIWDPWGRPGPP